MLLDLLVENAETSGQRTFLHDLRGTLSYAEFRAAVVEMSALLKRHGVAAGMRVGVLTNNSIESVVSLFSVNALGAVFVPVNHRTPLERIQFILSDCGVARVISNRQLDEELGLEGQVLDIRSSSRRVYLHAHNSAEGTLNAAPEELAALLYTSGSTGDPKGVMLTEQNLELAARSVAEYMHIEREDVLLTVLPISFDAGFSQITAAMVAGAGIALCNYLLPNDIPKIAERFGVTMLTAVPPLYGRMLEAKWNDATLARITKFASTGGDLAPKLLGKLRNLFPNAMPYPMYGLTEAFRATYLSPEDVDRKPGSVGKAIPYAEVFVLSEQGERCAPLEVGEIVQTGPLVAAGYWGRVDSDAGYYARFEPVPEFSTHSGMCVKTGDLGYMDEEGFLFFVGRRDGMLKVDGHRLSPLQLEAAMLDYRSVQECVVLIDDWSQTHRERIIGLLVLNEELPESDADLARSLTTHLSARGFGQSQVPVRYLRVEQLPRDLNGKIDRNASKRVAIDYDNT